MENSIKVLRTYDEVSDFLNDYSAEIRAGVQGESDGWNQKMTAINVILRRENIEIHEDATSSEAFEELINQI